MATHKTIDADAALDAVYQYYQEFSTLEVLGSVISALVETLGATLHTLGEGAGFTDDDGVVAEPAASTEDPPEWKREVALIMTESVSTLQALMVLISGVAAAEDSPTDVDDSVIPVLFEGDHVQVALAEYVWVLINKALVAVGADGQLLISGEDTSANDVMSHFWRGIASVMEKAVDGDSSSDEERLEAIKAAEENAEDVPDALIDSSLPVASGPSGGSSIAPILLAVGAVFLLANRKKRR